MQKPTILTQDQFDVALRTAPRNVRNAYFQLVTYVEALEKLQPTVTVTVTDNTGKTETVQAQIGSMDDEQAALARDAQYTPIPAVLVQLAPVEDEDADEKPRSSKRRGK